MPPCNIAAASCAPTVTTPECNAWLQYCCLWPEALPAVIACHVYITAGGTAVAILAVTCYNSLQLPQVTLLREERTQLRHCPVISGRNLGNKSVLTGLILVITNTKHVNDWIGFAIGILRCKLLYKLIAIGILWCKLRYKLCNRNFAM